MGQKELLRGKLMEMVKQGKITLKTACGQLKISYRQGIRIFKAYTERGDAGLIHGSRGKPSNRKTVGEDLAKAAELYRARYRGFGPTFAAAKMAENAALNISVSTLRRMLIAEGLWQGKRRSREYHSRREPRPRFGELIPFDGSPHDWFEGRGPTCAYLAKNRKNLTTEDQRNTEFLVKFLSFLRETPGTPWFFLLSIRRWGMAPGVAVSPC